MRVISPGFGNQAAVGIGDDAQDVIGQPPLEQLEDGSDPAGALGPDGLPGDRARASGCARRRDRGPIRRPWRRPRRRGRPGDRRSRCGRERGVETSARRIPTGRFSKSEHDSRWWHQRRPQKLRAAREQRLGPDALGVAALGRAGDRQPTRCGGGRSDPCAGRGPRRDLEAGRSFCPG